MGHPPQQFFFLLRVHEGDDLIYAAVFQIGNVTHSGHGGADFCLLCLHTGIHTVGVHPVFFKKDAAEVLFLQKPLQCRQIPGRNGRFPHDLPLQLAELTVHINSTVNRDPGQHVFFLNFQRMASGTQKHLHAAAL